MVVLAHPVRGIVVYSALSYDSFLQSRLSLLKKVSRLMVSLATNIHASAQAEQLIGDICSPKRYAVLPRLPSHVDCFINTEATSIDVYSSSK